MKTITLLTKIILIFLMISLSWIGLSAVLETFAYFNDDENSVGNTFTAGTLDFSLSTSTDDFVNLTPAEENWIAKRDITILNEGNLDFWYKVKVDQFSPECASFTLSLILEDGTTTTKLLPGFETGVIQFSTSTDDLKFKVGVEGEIPLDQPINCGFLLKFEARQDLQFSFGFSDEEEILNFVKTKREENSSPSNDIVINEFLPNPKGDDCSLTGINGEWVEIYNKGTISVDLNGWYLKDGSGNQITISSSTTHTGSTTIGGQDSGNEWLLVFLAGCILNNKGDTISLYNSNDDLIDSYTYSGAVPENKSFARYPDGSEKWYDPIPTPGGPNILEEPALEEENPSVEKEPIVPEADNETSGETEEINEINDEVIKEIVDETPVVEEQPATLPNESFSVPDGVGENGSDGGGSDEGGDTSGSSDGGSPAESAGESSGEGGDASESVSE